MHPVGTLRHTSPAIRKSRGRGFGGSTLREYYCDGVDMYGRTGGEELLPSSSGEVESVARVGSGPVSYWRVNQDLESILASDFSTE